MLVPESRKRPAWQRFWVTTKRQLLAALPCWRMRRNPTRYMRARPYVRRPGIAVPPALLFSPDGATAVAAVTAGYETAIRIGEALGSSRLLGTGGGGQRRFSAVPRAPPPRRRGRCGLNVTDHTRHAIALALVQAGGSGNGRPGSAGIAKPAGGQSRSAPASRQPQACRRAGDRRAGRTADRRPWPSSTAFGFEPSIPACLPARPGRPTGKSRPPA